MATQPTGTPYINFYFSSVRKCNLYISFTVLEKMSLPRNDPGSCSTWLIKLVVGMHPPTMKIQQRVLKYWYIYLVTELKNNHSMEFYALKFPHTFLKSDQNEQDQIKWVSHHSDLSIYRKCGMSNATKKVALYFHSKNWNSLKILVKLTKKLCKFLKIN